MFNDMLGTTQGTFSDGKYSKNNVTLFGETDNKETMFTGKPQIDGIGYAFLFRSYRPELAKWTPNFDRNFEFVRSESEAEQTKTADPLGYPDGFNNFAYVNNGVTGCIDFLGYVLVELIDNDAVGGLGHALPIAVIKNSDGGYTATGYDYGGLSSGGSSVDIHSENGKSESEVMKKILQYYDSNGNKYDNAYSWNVDDNKTKKAMDRMKAETKIEYKGKKHNCLDISKSGRREAGLNIKEGAEYRPSSVHGYRTKSEDITKYLKKVQKSYAE